ncbi:hypothetical protein KPH14_012845 [Odynerus spinipes]|uniref:Copia protein n=1 Tax=Odynerus spinipes TaxID=1348599 RepID=A0AAD9VKV5_9HYME|nr:hypothetical protein KPH14_012845 [Odynerus spinipes]
MWRSNKQRSVGLSTCVAELFACSETVKDIIWVKNILVEMNFYMFYCKPIILYCDNRAAIEWIGNNRSSTKTRHVNMKFHFIRDEIEKGELSVRHIDTKHMIADFLTKAITREKLLWSLKEIGLVDIET